MAFCGEAADFLEVRGLPDDEEEADVAEVPLDFGAGNVGERGEVDDVAVVPEVNPAVDVDECALADGGGPGELLVDGESGAPCGGVGGGGPGGGEDQAAALARAACRPRTRTRTPTCSGTIR